METIFGPKLGEWCSLAADDGMPSVREGERKEVKYVAS